MGLLTSPMSSPVATFDVQNAIANGGSEISMTGQFINNSRAPGCFLVFQCDDGSPDEFRVILRNVLESSVTAMISVPPSTYTMYVYDLEEDGNIIIEPAYFQRSTIETDGKFKPNTNFAFLKMAELSKKGSEVNISCGFTDDYPEVSCVLVYREYNDPYLTVKEYNRSTLFPDTIYISVSTGEYTFAVFGRNGKDNIEAEPVIKLKNEGRMVYPQMGMLLMVCMCIVS